MSRLYLFIPGIHADCEGIDAWHERAIDYVQTTAHETGRCYEYSCWALTRRFRQKSRVRAVADLIRKYAAFDVVPVCHSNGAAILTDALRYPDVKVHTVHLVAAACDADFEKNGLNDALDAGRVQCVYCYVSLGDTVLKRWAKCSQKAFGWFGAGFGSLGFDGPENIPQHLQGRVLTRRQDWMGHSSWLQGENFNELMRRVVFS